MKTKAAILFATAPVLCAGVTEPVPEPAPEAAAEYWIKPTIDVRARYEYGDIDGFEDSNAFTIRERVGLMTAEWYGISAFVEGEFTQAAVADYHGGAPGARPFKPSHTVIADPETNELNQGYIQYAGFDSVLKAGRQRIILDNAAFVGNVGWRQNEQTFDAISLTNKSLDGLALGYSYIDQVNRIFGSDADAPLVAGPPPFDNVQDINAEVHLLNASYSGLEGLTLGAYAYLMDFPDKPNWDNNTFGMSAKSDVYGFTLYGELAWQDDAGFGNTEDALYAHGSVTKGFAGQTVTVGVEHLDAGFKTPLATVHAFNGFADAFIGGRIEGAHNGLTDVYVSHTIPLFWGIKWTNALHAFGDNEISNGYGWEYDSVLAKKFDEHFLAIAKLAYFQSEGDPFVGGAAGAALADTTRFSVELNYSF
ncbi:MAG: hypothetical protein H7A49_16150 [Akkermansiaceae bacterium]|nr:hypothetical protein [Akkermansiaceae bacterium]MCP5545428.1 hypothetical protein [Akkermansiaceae bacterium]MCP5547600.1 hypothetical protein [Akkermansiaceae bacterium]